jgi:excisionase family DNA binding protein
MAEPMHSAEEAARILGLQVRTVRGYLRDGRLPGVRIGKQYRIARSDLEAFTAGTAGAGDGEGGMGRGEKPPAPRRTQPEVSSVVQIDGISKADAERLERTLAAVTGAMSSSTGAAPEPGHLRVEPLFDERRERLRLIIVGDIGATHELLRVIELFR